MSSLSAASLFRTATKPSGFETLFPTFGSEEEEKLRALVEKVRCLCIELIVLKGKVGWKMKDIWHRLMAQLGCLGSRVFRNQTRLYWTGKCQFHFAS